MTSSPHVLLVTLSHLHIKTDNNTWKSSLDSLILTSFLEILLIVSKQIPEPQILTPDKATESWEKQEETLSRTRLIPVDRVSDLRAAIVIFAEIVIEYTLEVGGIFAVYCYYNFTCVCLFLL